MSNIRKIKNNLKSKKSQKLKIVEFNKIKNKMKIRCASR
jgi:hypothetical protein